MLIQQTPATFSMVLKNNIILQEGKNVHMSTRTIYQTKYTN